MKPSVSTAALLLLCSAGIVTFLRAGPLTPPAGPVASTFKTLSEVEPRIAINSTNTPGDADSLFKITQPGSYYLTGNITGVSGKHGVEIASGGVTLDLAGFELQGVPGSLDGVSDTAGVSNVHIRNGSIRDWGDRGVDCVSSESASIADLSARNCVGTGIGVGRYSTVARCRVESNGGGGISTTFDCLLTGCTVELGGFGIFTGAHCRVVDCLASGNGDNGITTGVASTIAGCAVTGSAVTGFALSSGCTISNSSASANAGTGITAGDGCTVASCTSTGNAAHGIAAASNSVVSGCSTAGNALDGIVAGTKCLITGNQCGASGAPSASGIHITGTDNRIEGNLLTNNTRGLDVDAAGNLIVRNAASGNTTNWDIVAGNSGLFTVAATGAALAGNAGGAALGSTDPWVNFTF